MKHEPGVRRHLEPPRLNLTAMVDVFTVLLVFLLKSYSAEGTLTAAAQNLELPASTSSLTPQPTITITISEDTLFVDDERVGALVELTAGDAPYIPELGQALKARVDKARLIAGSNPSHSFQGRVTILGDKNTPFATLERVMYTASLSEFGDIALAVYQKGRSG
ncbi:MAG: biopolymer transporter ExbD [Nitrospirota bacterium]